MKPKMDVSTPPDEPIIVMTRTLDAPREIIWSIFTDPKHVAKWYGGYGFENPVCEMDVRPGGKWRHVMRTPDGAEYEMNFVFVEVVRPEKLVWQHADHGKATASRHPTSVMTVTLEDAGKQTKWKLVSRFASLAERERALGMGFTTVLGEGNEKLNEIAKALTGAAS